MVSSFVVTNNAATHNTIVLDGEKAASGGGIEAVVTIGRKSQAGKLRIIDWLGYEVFKLESPFGAHMTVGASQGLAGLIHVIDGSGEEGVLIDGAGRRIAVKNGSGVTTIELDGDDGDIRLSGADCAELFDVGDTDLEAGTVLVIDGVESLRPCERAYDQRVAGVVSGAGGRRPGVVLNRDLAGGAPVALSGRVFCLADASESPIEVGDLLTTSGTRGHAMRAEPTRAAGTILGKAMAPLDAGRGLIPALVALA